MGNSMSKILKYKDFFKTKKSLSSLIFICVVTICVLLMSTITSINILNIYSDIKKQSKEYLKNTASISKENFNSWFENKINILNLLERDIVHLQSYENVIEKDLKG